jgi:hypothetical protein
MKVHKLPPLQLGHEFDGWSEFQVTGRVTILQGVMLFFSSLFFFALTLSLVFVTIATKPEGVLEELHKFELQCLAAGPA